MAPQTIHGIHPRPADRIEAIAYDETAKEIILVEVQFTQVWSISLDGEWNDKIVDLGRKNIYIAKHGSYMKNSFVLNIMSE